MSPSNVPNLRIAPNPINATHHNTGQLSQAAVSSSSDRAPPRSAENTLAIARAMDEEMAHVAQTNRVSDHERAENTNRVHHGDPTQPLWYNFRPTQALDFGREARDWTECLDLYGYSHR
jgi:hypothetical protein